MPRYTRMVSLATVVLPTASKRSTRWPVSSPVAEGVAGAGRAAGGSVTIRPESGRGMIVPGFGFGGGCC